MEIRKIMSAPVESILVHDSAATALKVMREKKIRHLPVVDDSGAVCGVLSDRDLRDFMVPLGAVEGVNREEWYPDRVKVESMMHGEPTVITASEDVRRVVQIMVDGGFNCLPIVDRSELVGIVTSTDLMKALAKILDLIEAKSDPAR